MTAKIHRSVLLPYPVKHVFDVVADVVEYQKFLPYCDESVVLEQMENEVTAGLLIRYKGFVERIVTTNRLNRYSKIELRLIEGPFKEFRGDWTFKDLMDGCRVELSLDFAVSNQLIHSFTHLIVREVADQILDAFATRARILASQ